MQLVKKSGSKYTALETKQLSREQIVALKSDLAWQIVTELSHEPAYPKQLSRLISVHEQKIYYHIRKLEKAGIVQPKQTEIKGGAVAQYYSLTSSAFAIVVKDDPAEYELPVKSSEYLFPFVDGGKLNALIVVGSPDPHGPERVRTKDGCYGIDIALFLGSFCGLHNKLRLKLDTEMTDADLQHNLILIGGPRVNMTTAKVNGGLPVYFDKTKGWAVTSRVSGKVFNSDEAGIIVKSVNPFNPKKHILVLAGRRAPGMRAVIISLLKHFSEIVAGNSADSSVDAKIIEGMDLDSDGVIDTIEILE